MRRLLITALIAMSVALAVPPASAGGPTSVMITDPASGRATALYYTDSRYAELEALLAAGKTVEGEPPGRRGSAVNLTWMLHDVDPWRIQQLHPDADRGPILVTYGTEIMGNDAQVTWSRIADSDGLAALLDRILRPRAAPATAEIESPTPEPLVERTVVTETQTAWYSLTGWRWLIPGMLIGAGFVLLASGRRTEDPDPPLRVTDIAPGDELSAQR